jgi:hypothetical protein
LNTANAIDKALHAWKRRVIFHAFSEKALKSMEEDFLANIRNGFKGARVKTALNMVYTLGITHIINSLLNLSNPNATRQLT